MRYIRHGSVKMRHGQGDFAAIGIHFIILYQRCYGHNAFEPMVSAVNIHILAGDDDFSLPVTNIDYPVLQEGNLLLNRLWLWQWPI